MYPIICKIGPFTIYSYGLMLVVAFLVGSFLASRQAKRENVNPEIILNLTFIAFISGVIGARIFYIIENFNYYKISPLEIVMLQRGGLSWFGGLFMGVLSAFLYLRRHKIKIYKILDIISPYLALAQALGRIGCLLNGCCFGKVSSFGIYFPVHGAVLIPTQAYSSLFLVFIFIVLKIFQDRPHQEGQIFFLYLLLYSVKRFFIEFWRADNPAALWGLTLFQILSIVLFFFSIAKLLQIRKSKNR